MGAAVSVDNPNAPPTPVLTPRISSALQTTTRLTPEELELLGVHFRKAQEAPTPISTEALKGGIDQARFQVALGLPQKESLYVDRMFFLMDADHDGLITFQEFTNVVSLLSTKTPMLDKIAFSFQIIDLDGDGRLSKNDVHEFLHTSIVENNILLTKDQVTQIIDHTFLDVDADKDGFVSLDEYAAFMARNENSLSHFTLNLAYLLNLTSTASALGVAAVS
ncbi:hypothetical protein ACHHYP_02841 [Achlya hypogyna]|uniref:EF-hand domain-containing protein n=1 Tax=Achlya hypogyna TaxID=1202772 RepID=A0A1V9ZRT7_ACHHY|nr:hypothetical protein ACHHYP_02841 [Achlya hypogyna]